MFCSNAAAHIRSFMPVGLGIEFQLTEEELLRALDMVPAAFAKAIRKAQKQGWANK